ncbi:MAG TPA: diguanylate cyclase, partial [Leptolinea sp.]
PSQRGLFLYPALLSIWLAISCAALFFADTRIALAGTLILAAVAVASLVLISIVLVWGVDILTIIVFGAMLNELYGIHPSSIYTYITFVAAVSGTAILAWNTSKQILSSNRQVERDRILIEEMRINDQKTGLMRFHYARRTFSTEISRSLRYDNKLSLLLMKINKWGDLAEQLGLETRDNLLAEVSEVLFNNCRNVDTLFLNIDKIGVILPETKSEGAGVIARRFAAQVKKKTKLELHIGIVSFPDDSNSDEDLMRKAETALINSIETGHGIVFFKSLPIIGEEIELKEDSETPAEDVNLLNLQPVETSPSKELKAEETAIHFIGICTLSDIEILQKALEKITSLGTIRLVDFAENEIIFSVDAQRSEIAEKLLINLEIPNISIDDQQKDILITLDPKINLKEINKKE